MINNKLLNGLINKIKVWICRYFGHAFRIDPSLTLVKNTDTGSMRYLLTCERCHMQIYSRQLKPFSEEVVKQLDEDIFASTHDELAEEEN